MSFPDGTPWLVGWMGTRAGRKGEDDDGDYGDDDNGDDDDYDYDEMETVVPIMMTYTFECEDLIYPYGS